MAEALVVRLPAPRGRWGLRILLAIAFLALAFGVGLQVAARREAGVTVVPCSKCPSCVCPRLSGEVRCGCPR